MKCMKTVRKAAPWVCVLLAVLMLVPTLPVATRAADSGLDVSYMKTVHTETFDGRSCRHCRQAIPPPRGRSVPAEQPVRAGHHAGRNRYPAILLCRLQGAGPAGQARVRDALRGTAGDDRRQGKRTCRG